MHIRGLMFPSFLAVVLLICLGFIFFDKPVLNKSNWLAGNLADASTLEVQPLTVRKIGTDADTDSNAYKTQLILKNDEIQFNSNDITDSLPMDSNRMPNLPVDNNVIPDQKDTQPKPESDSLKIIKNFYLYMASDNEYMKALDLLDSQVKIRLNALKKLGYNELTKADIDVNKYSDYSSILKTARLDNIVEEKVSGDTSTIYYYQTFSKQDNIEVRLPLIATVKNTANGPKIFLIEEGNENEKPFLINGQ